MEFLDNVRCLGEPSPAESVNMFMGIEDEDNVVRNEYIYLDVNIIKR